MAIALVATVLFVPRTPRPAAPAPLSAPLKALRHRGLLTMGVTALLYNWGFFTMLGYVPFPMHLSIYELGAVFFGWGVLVALFSVFVAPRLQRRFGTAPTLYVNLALFAVVLAVIAAFTDYPAVLVVCVVVAGAMIGVNNTLTTQAVMLGRAGRAAGRVGRVRLHPVHRRRPRPVRGGAAGRAASTCTCRSGSARAPCVAAIAVLASGHRLLAAADVELAAGEVAHAGEPDLDARELEEIREDGTGEPGVRERAEAWPAATRPETA